MTSGTGLPAANEFNSRQAGSRPVGALLILGLLASGSVSAALCSVTGSTIYPNSGTCAEVSAKVLTRFGGSEGTPIPPSYSYSPGSGTSNVIIADTGGEASATASAQIGLLRLTTVSTVGTPDTQTAAQARATAAFADYGTVTLPGGTLGDLVNAFVTVDIQGSQTGAAGIIDAHLNVGNIFNVSFPNGIYRFQTHIGDVIPVSLGFSIYADSSYLFPASAADYGHSAHLYFDFDEDGVYFDSVSGHDYNSAAVPAPPAAWLLATGLAGLCASVRRSRRGSASNVNASPK